MSSTYNGMPQLNEDNSSGSGSDVVCQVLNSMSLHSWVYPQSTLPSSMISAYINSGPGRGLLMRVQELCFLTVISLLSFIKRSSFCCFRRR